MIEINVPVRGFDAVDRFTEFVYAVGTVVLYVVVWVLAPNLLALRTPDPVEQPGKSVLVAVLLVLALAVVEWGRSFVRRDVRTWWPWGASPPTAAFFDPRSVGTPMSGLRDALRELPEAVFADLLESDEAYLLVLDLPGVTADSADVSVESGRLHIEARRNKDLPADYTYLREDRSLFLDANLPLPPDASDSGAEASMKRGVLEVRLPKRESAPERTIPISDN